MGHGSMFGRVIQWLANEIIVKGLSENPAFQRFAVRSSQQMQDLTKSAAEAAKSLSASENVVQLRKESQALKKQASDFASALREEIQETVKKASEEGRRGRNM